MKACCLHEMSVITMLLVRTRKDEGIPKSDPRYRRLRVETERSGVPYRESKPSAHRHRTARTTQQINGAMDFCGLGESRWSSLLTG